MPPEAPLPAVPQADPRAAYLEQRAAIEAVIAAVLARGRYVLGPETAGFETEFAAAMGCRHAIGVGSGTDALILALRALGVRPGEWVATVSHTAVATVAAIEAVGARPLLVDIDPATFTMDAAELARTLDAPPLGERVAAVLAVHLYGHPADLEAITSLTQRHRVPLVEDCAQAHGATFAGRPVGSFGNVACFSFYPTKNLGALGDGGALTTNDDGMAAELRALREYGWRERRHVSERAGINSRLDELQAAVLRVKLPRLGLDNARRRAIAARYDAELAGLALLRPQRDRRISHVFHQYVVRCAGRDGVRARLQAAGIGTGVHYPVPVHRQPAYVGRLAHGPGGLGHTERVAAEILSLPIYPQLENGAIDHVVAALRAACPRRDGQV